MSDPAAGRAPLQVGLTGNIGSGKSSVAALLAEHGAAVIDADALAREATDDPEVLAQVAIELGPELVLTEAEGPRLDRAATADLVFADSAALARLNAIVHPWVRGRSAQLAAEYAHLSEPPAVVVHDIPLLYENDLQRGLAAVVVVSAPLAQRVARVVARSNIEPAEVIRRDGNQLPLQEKIARADFVVDNAGDPVALEAKVAKLWRELLKLRELRPDES